MEEQAFSIQFAVRVIDIQYAVEPVFLEVTRDEYVLIFVAFVFEFVYIRFDITRKRSVGRPVRVQFDIQFGFPIRVAVRKDFVQMQGGSREVASQVGGDVLLLVATENQVGLDGTDCRREFAECDQIVEKTGYLSCEV